MSSVQSSGGPFSTAGQGTVARPLLQSTKGQIAGYISTIKGLTPPPSMMNVTIYGELDPGSHQFLEDIKFVASTYPAFLQHMIQQRNIEVRVGKTWADIPGPDGEKMFDADSIVGGAFYRLDNMMGIPTHVNGQENSIKPQMIVAHELGHIFDHLAACSEFMDAYETDLRDLHSVHKFSFDLKRIYDDTTLNDKQKLTAVSQTLEKLGVKAEKANLVFENEYFLPQGHGGDLKAARKEAFAELFAVMVSPDVCRQRKEELAILFPNSSAVMEKIVNEMKSAYALQRRPAHVADANVQPVRDP